MAQPSPSLLTLVGQAFRSWLTIRAGVMPRTRLSPIPLGADYQGAPKRWNERAALENFRSWVYAAGMKKAERISSLKVSLHFERASDGEKVEVRDHPANQVLRRPNALMSWMELELICELHLELTGNAYLLKLRDAIGTPVGLWPLAPHLTTAKLTRGPELIEGYNFWKDGAVGAGKPEFFPASEVIHRRLPNPGDPVYGLPTIAAAAGKINSERRIVEYEDALFRDGARFDYAVSVDLPPTADAKDLLETLEANVAIRHRGSQKWALPLFLPGSGSKIQPVNWSAVDMQFDKLKETNRDDILAMLGVSKSILGFSGEVNRTDSEAQLFQFNQHTILPRVLLAQDQLNAQWIEVDYEVSGGRLMLCFENPVPEDKAFELERMKAGVAGGWVAPNENRKKEGRQPVKGGDEPLVASMVVPLSQVGEAPPEPDKQPAAPPAKPSEGDGGDSKPKPKSAAATVTRLIPAKSLSVRTTEGRDAYWKRVSRELDRVERQMLRGTKRAFSEQRDRVVEDFRKLADELQRRLSYPDGRPMGRRRRAAAIADLVRRDEASERSSALIRMLWDDRRENFRMQASLRPWVQGAVNAGGRYGASLIGLSFDSTNPAVADFMAVKVPKLAGVLNETTKTDVANAIADGLRENESMEAIVGRIRGVFDEADRSRAYLIARTESTSAYNAGTVAAWEDPKAEGIVVGKMWVATRDSRTRESHAELDGETTRELDGKFSNGLTNPGDPSGPPEEVCNCRCLVTPIIRGSREESELLSLCAPGTHGHHCEAAHA